MITIVLNPEEKTRLDYEQGYKELMSFETYLSVLDQRATFVSNEKGYQVYSHR